MSHCIRGFIVAVVASVLAAQTVPATAARPADKVAGVYDLSFFVNEVGELILRAHIARADDPDVPATDGVVVFQYCSLVGVPHNDITQPDEAASSACADGSGHWLNLRARVPVRSDGDALLDFGLVRVVTVIGFRYKYSGGSEIADAVTDPEDWFRL